MKRNEKPLSETNPYFQDPKERDRRILIAASSSSAIEGIHVPLKVFAQAGSRRARSAAHSVRSRFLSSRSAFVAFPPVPRQPAMREMAVPGVTVWIQDSSATRSKTSLKAFAGLCQLRTFRGRSLNRA